MWRIGVAFLLGHCLIHSLGALPEVWPWAAVAAAALAVAAIARNATAVALILGLAWAWGHAAARLSEELPVDLEGMDLQVRGSIASLPRNTETDVQFELEVHAAQCVAEACVSTARVPPRIALAWYDHEQVPRPGETWQLEVRLKRRNGFANPGGMDYEGLLFRNGIGGSGYVRESSFNQRLAEPAASYAVVRMRGWVARRIELAMGPHPMLGVVQGLAVGDTHAITSAQWRVFGATGTTHLLAISGLHISMIAALAAWLGGCIVRWRGAQARRLTAVHGQAIAGAMAAVLYSLLAGLSVPTQRTLVMLCVFFLARLCRRHSSTADALGIALLGVLLVDPFAPLAVGAWLSFGAVALILLAVGGWRGREGVIRSFSRMQLVMTVGLAPMLITVFGSLSLVAPLANAVAVPCFTFIAVPLVLLGACVASFSLSAGALLLTAAGWLLEQCWWLLQRFAELPMAVVQLPAPTPLLQVALICGALLWVMPGIWPLKVIAALLCLPALIKAPPAPREGEYLLAVLDVGQGLASVIQTRSHVLVYDTGPAFRSGRDTGELVLLPYLRSRGIRHVDLLMLSHDDLDHRGGVRSLLQGMPVHALLFGPSVRSVSRDAGPAIRQPCRRGLQWTWDGVHFEVQHPVRSEAAGDNDSSCVLRVATSGGSVLLTGDIERDAEAELVAASLPPTDIVVVPHHGSRSSSTPGFVAAVQARWAVISAGYRNRWGMPRPEVMQRWRDAGTRPLVTSEEGAIEIEVGGQGIGIPRRHRDEHPHYWSR